MLDSGSPILAIPDLQMPFEHERALTFCKYIAKHYKIPPNNILNLGDETDSLHGGSFPKDPNGQYSATGELRAVRDKIAQWADAFPVMKLAVSNHGLRWLRKATAAEIPSQLLRDYREIIGAPTTWVWRDQWVFGELKHPFRMIHGMGFSGKDGHRNAAIDAGMSTMIGHLHSFAAIDYIRTSNQNIWAFNVGSLIDQESYAFHYAKESRFKACIGAGVIFKSGSMPVWIPID